MRKDWDFYGRNQELAEVEKIISSGRWFFCSISGRRRIGKTTLIQKAAGALLGGKIFYVQIPDSDERGIVHAFREALEDFEETWGENRADGLIRTFRDVAHIIAVLNFKGIIVVIDEFQYFHRKTLSPFTSYLQAEVDRLRDTERGGLFVLGSIHTEMIAILDDQASPLFNRVTHKIQVGHWDFETLFEMFAVHDISDPKQWLFLWSLFEGVPKFYRDCFDQGVLAPSDDHRQTTLLHLFFEGSSPLRDEAANWFLRELRGRFDSILKILARKGPCSRGQLKQEYRQLGGGETELGSYLKILIDEFRMVEKLDPIFSSRKMRRARYAIADNFLSAWLNAIARNVQMARVQPIDKPLSRAESMLSVHEGYVFEKMTRQLTEEASRKGVGDFPLTDFVRGYWNKADGSDIEIDLVCINEDDKVVRFGSCKRNPGSHAGGELTKFNGHVDRFLMTKEGKRFTDWTVQRALYAPAIDAGHKKQLTESGYHCLDIESFRNVLYTP